MKLEDIKYPSDFRKISAIGGQREIMYRAWRKIANRQDSLDMRLSAGVGLDRDEIDQMMEIFGKRCQTHTKARLREKLERVPNISGSGIFRRIHIENGIVSYCAGQDYPSEIRLVRELLLKA